MIKSINKEENLVTELDKRLMEELEAKVEFDCWIKYCSNNYQA